MKPADLLALLQEFYGERLLLRQHHESGARAVRSYEVNNTYQYVIAREDVQLSWVRAAIVECGGVPAEPAGAESDGGGLSEADVIRRDAEDARAFVERWTPRVEAMTQARHRKMLRVILGETLEHKRFFDQAAAGLTNILGRRPPGAGTTGGVMPTRWVGDR